MSPEEIKHAVLDCLHSVAPEADLASLGGDVDLRDTLDIDSMDFLRFVVGLHDVLHVDIAERDYAQMRTLDACIRFLQARLAAPQA